MQDYFAENWKAVFELNGLRNFDDLWTLKAAWFEEPNQRRGGWSGVARHELVTPDGGRRAIFLKRQENHVTKTLLHPLRGMATLVREFKNFRRFDECQVPTAHLVHFAQRRVNGQLRALLITEELAGFRSLEDWLRDWQQTGWPALAERLRLIEAIAAAVRQMHRHRLRHDCLWSKHVFLKGIGGAAGQPVEARIIDLEKTKRTLFRKSAMLRDLSTLERDCELFSKADRLRFCRAYLQGASRQKAQDLWRAIATVQARRAQRRQGKRRGRSNVANV